MELKDGVKRPAFNVSGTEAAIDAVTDQALALYNTLDPQGLTKDMNTEYTAKLQALLRIANDRILLPELRFQNGAYGVQQSIDETNMWVMSYRDPKPKETCDFY